MSTGPLYFYDQVKMKTTKRVKKMPEELPPDMKYININPRLANFINSINKSRKGVSTQAEKKQLSLSNEDKAQKEKDKFPVLPEINGANPPKNSIENPNPKPTHFLTDDDQFMSPFEDYKYVAPTLLYELGKLLHFFSQYEIIFPQGVINILYYSWKELIEGAVYNKKHCQSQPSKKGTADQSQVPEESENKQPGTVPPENVDSLKNTKNKTNATLAESGKEKGGQHTNKASGNKSPQSFASHLPVTISFSMASRACEDRGWILQKTDSASEAMELKGLCTWAVERLQLAQMQINKQLTSIAEKGWTKPVVVRYYENTGNKRNTDVKQRKTVKAPSFMLVRGMPLIPEIKRDNPSLRKLHFGLIDGSSVV
ncbi:uncharacterized protein LOC128491946 [Spea bombifrons]|uniref:uncharacterized protein LOC128491946 n=1 Tax=Spea bombifrons TaxID=233779 RepID=UPI00234A7145|nr:uncharacterized protein LOC128491946 [Spea bombifrons]